jgi:hypothetical protein
MQTEDRFENAVSPVWDIAEIGSGIVTPSADGLRLTVNPTRQYSNAQIDDYYVRDAGKLHFNFRWRPPLRMSVTAWAQKPDTLKGTAGFGFWNHPFSPDMKRLPRLPQAIWFFFSSPPNHMQLAYGVPGFGWKAATIDATRALHLAPFALPAILLMRVPRLYSRLWQPIQRALKIGECALNIGLLASPHTYTIDWQLDHAVFAVNNVPMLKTPFAPRGALGFVAWLDNQYAIVTPQGKFGFGVLPIEEAHTMILEHVLIEKIQDE